MFFTHFCNKKRFFYNFLHASIGPWRGPNNWSQLDIKWYKHLFVNAIHFCSFLSFPHAKNMVSQMKKNTNSHLIGVTSISKYHNWIQLKLNHLLIHEAQLGFFSFKSPYCLRVFRLIKPPLIVMITHFFGGEKAGCHNLQTVAELNISPSIANQYKSKFTSAGSPALALTALR